MPPLGSDVERTRFEEPLNQTPANPDVSVTFVGQEGIMERVDAEAVTIVDDGSESEDSEPDRRESSRRET
jgi:hypothetical protein